MSRRQKWLIACSVCASIALVGLFVASRILSRRFEPYIRAQAIEYLAKRFDSHVELTALRVRLPEGSPLRMLFRRGRGAIARVEGEGLSLRHRNRLDVPPMLAIRKFAFEVELGSLLENPKHVRSITLEGLEIAIPPKDQRPRFGSDSDDAASGAASQVLIEKIAIGDAKLAILPADPAKAALRFDIQSLLLTPAPPGAWRYDAALTNPKPPGAIHSTGTFGPWSAGVPGDTPIAGEYTFEHADLGVFAGIAGMLQSHGSFQGTLDSLHASGEATVPDFRLKRAGNRVPLQTQFAVLVDGTNGNTTLQPVRVTLGNTRFTTSGAVIKHEKEQRRSISLDVAMPNGNLRDVLRLAMKGTPFMEGQLALRTKIRIPPLSGSVTEKLVLDGQFEIVSGKFLRSAIQDKIDELSRRGQGQPKNGEIDEVVSGMQGAFKLDDRVIEFRHLTFRVPGAAVDLRGSYDLAGDHIDFHGTLKLEAKVSQTQTGWKRFVLKPVDPFFAKNGAGTFLRIKVEGNSAGPKFGLDRGSKEKPAAKSAQNGLN
ncbi:MAG TPA: AsmA-like C-terminal region-containing protein [Candidatus Solibacter sp.]|nr:AsmA-like C-terminal region-containing protein [Candidatus Solibacter sp.]